MELKNKTKFLLVFGIIFVAFLLFNTNKVSATEISKPGMVIDGNKYELKYADLKVDDSITLGEPMLKEKIEGITLSKTIKDGYGKDDINYNVIVNEEIFKKNYEVGYYDKYKDSEGNITIQVYVEIPNDIVWMAYGTGTHFSTAKIEEINGKNYFKHDVIIRYNSMSFEEDFNIEVMDGQDVCYIFDNGEGEAVVWKRKSNAIVFNRIIVKSETIKNETIKNEDTNIELNADTNVIPSNTKLEAKEIKVEKILNVVKESLKEISNKYISYDITLKSDGVAIQPNGKVKISIPIPSDFDKTKLSIFRVLDDGTKIKYDTKIENNFATIETDHFSTYVLAENNVVINNDNTEKNEQENTSIEPTQESTETTNKGEKDKTPKTGTIDIIGYVLATTILAGVGIVALKKNLK